MAAQWWANLKIGEASAEGGSHFYPRDAFSMAGAIVRIICELIGRVVITFLLCWPGLTQIV